MKCIVAGLLGVLAAAALPSAASAPERSASGPSVDAPSAARGTPPLLADARTLLDRFDAGLLPGAQRPSEAEVAVLQQEIGHLNTQYAAGQSRKMQRLGELARARIDSGEASPLTAEGAIAFALPASASGARFEVRGEDRYFVTIFPGECAELDAIESERAATALRARQLVEAAFRTGAADITERGGGR